jgi:hypothetical protein
MLTGQEVARAFVENRVGLLPDGRLCVYRSADHARAAQGRRVSDDLPGAKAPVTGAVPPPGAPMVPPEQFVEAFIAERTVPLEPGEPAREGTTASALFAAFEGWAKARGLRPNEGNASHFGKTMHALGHRTRMFRVRNAEGRQIIECGREKMSHAYAVKLRVL